MRVLKHAVVTGINYVNCGKLLHFGSQNNRLYVWAMEPAPGQLASLKTIMVVPTGSEFHPIYGGIEPEHLGSVVEPDSSVWHAFI